ncbi:MAG: anaerobic ribonucleoside-triphosphate reductase activating protein [Bacteroidaceae bacterium]|nr:anaerobic ribonucleoside-triphosphate reductase activating protein [Bacteroidaceae bacterium]
MSLHILSILEDTTVDGPGFRTSIYCAGCTHHCPGCHNPQSWAKDSGEQMSLEDIMAVIEADPFAPGVTFTGGDPMQQPEGFTELARLIHKRTKKNIWCYTGYTFEDLLDMPAQRQLLDQLDVLVDGPFIKACKKDDLLFRGSSNQRIIDVPRSLNAGHVVEWQRTYHNKAMA